MSRRRRYLEKLYWRLHDRIVPGVESSQRAYAGLVTSHVNATTRWLDVGCGRDLWPAFVPGVAETAGRAALLVGLDPDRDSLRENRVVHHRVCGMGLPFRDGAFTLVTANMVFEHLEHPAAMLAEIRRVLMPGGVCIVHTPNARYWQIAVGRYLPQWLKNTMIRFSEDREAKDVFPTYYRINTERAMRQFAREAGLDADEVIMLNTSSTGRIFLLGPFVLLELLWIRLTQGRALRQHRSNIVAFFRNAPSARGAAAERVALVTEAPV